MGLGCDRLSRRDLQFSDYFVIHGGLNDTRQPFRFRILGGRLLIVGPWIVETISEECRLVSLTVHASVFVIGRERTQLLGAGVGRAACFARPAWGQSGNNEDCVGCFAVFGGIGSGGMKSPS